MSASDLAPEQPLIQERGIAAVPPGTPRAMESSGQPFELAGSESSGTGSAAGEKLSLAEARELNQEFQNASTEKILDWAWRRFGKRAAIGTSFQGAGLVMIHLARQCKLPVAVFTLDTGLLFPETLALKQRLEDFWGIPIESLEPDLTVAEQADINGPELWKQNPDLCCTIRKVLPLRDKLYELDCWITGLRRQQSDTRAGIGIVELYAFDEAAGRDIVKLNPMANWSREAIWEYIRAQKIPYNPLHDQGYRSIGCQPCTAKATQNASERAGRWIGFNKVECGIHTFMPKKVDFQI
jgi:phosphoadenosine phosphosulfate reductase